MRRCGPQRAERARLSFFFSFRSLAAAVVAPRLPPKSVEKALFRPREPRLRRAHSGRRMPVDVSETPPSRLGRKEGARRVGERAVKAFVGGVVVSLAFSSRLSGEKKGKKRHTETLSPPSQYRLPRRRRRPRVLSGTLSTRLCDKNGDRSAGRVPRGEGLPTQLSLFRSFVVADDEKKKRRALVSILLPTRFSLALSSFSFLPLTLASSMIASLILEERFGCFFCQREGERERKRGRDEFFF